MLGRLFRPRPTQKASGPAREPRIVRITFDQKSYDITLRRHPLARRYSLRIHPHSGEALLTLPPRGTIKEATAFAERHGAWLAARLNRMAKLVAFADGGTLPLRGIAHRIVHRPQARGTVWIECGAEGDALICVAGGAAHVGRRVTDFLKREARADLREAVMRHAAQLQVKPKRIAIRDQTSRWGSCTSEGVLSFSWRLIFAPPFVLDYLAAHEVAHLVELNHSRKFWRLVESLNVDMHRAKIWLDQHGAQLHRYGQTRARSAPE